MHLNIQLDPKWMQRRTMRENVAEDIGCEGDSRVEIPLGSALEYMAAVLVQESSGALESLVLQPPCRAHIPL